MKIRNPLGARLGARSTVATAMIGLLAIGATACGSSSKSSAGNGAGSTTTVAKSSSTTTGGTSGDTTSAKGPNPCSLITDAQAQQILGGTATNDGPKSENRGTNCNWKTSNGGFVLVQVYEGKEFYDPQMQGNNPTKLPGVADDAFVDDFGNTRTMVGFIKGNTVVFIDGDDIASSTALVNIAKGVAANV
jgi:hypothetical protein